MSEQTTAKILSPDFRPKDRSPSQIVAEHWKGEQVPECVRQLVALIEKSTLRSVSRDLGTSHSNLYFLLRNKGSKHQREFVASSETNLLVARLHNNAFGDGEKRVMCPHLEKEITETRCACECNTNSISASHARRLWLEACDRCPNNKNSTA